MSKHILIFMLLGLVIFLFSPLLQPADAEWSALPLPAFPVVESNSWMTEPVSLHDFVPFGVALEKLPDGRIVIDRAQGWTASNFVPFGMCWDEQNTLIFHSSVNIGGSHFRLMFNGQRFYRFLQGPSYYDESGRYFPFPTVHTNPANDFVNIIAYDEKTRTWYHKILDQRTDPPTEILYVKGRGRLAPLWVGKPEGPFVVHGIAGIQRGWLMLDTWGGYLDFEELLECRFHDPRTGQTYEFKEGFTFMDREYHRDLPLGELAVQGGQIVDGVEFDCMSFHKTEGEAVEFIFCQALNPLPSDIKGKFEFPPFQRFGRIAFPGRGETYRFDDYEFWTDGKLQPDLYFLRGNFTDEEGNVVGSVDLMAEAEAFWGRGGRESWRIYRPWWDPEGEAAWGRSFVRWRGTITLRGETIEVEGIPGFGEFHRYGGEHLVRLAVSNSWMTDIPTLEDEYPWGITLELEDGVVKLKPPFKGVCGWTLGNGFFAYGLGETEDGQHTLNFMGGIKLGDGADGAPAIFIDGERYSPAVGRTSSILRYDAGELFGAPTIYTDPSEYFVAASTYHYPEPRWTFQLYSRDGKYSLVIELHARGVPFWLGKATGPYVVFGLVHPDAPDTFNVWGGFIWFCSFTATLKTPEHGELVFKGWAVKDREYHRCVGPDPRSGHVASYTAVAISQGEFDLIIYESFNPLTGERWAHQGRLNFPELGLSFRFDRFEYEDDGSLVPRAYELHGRYERGEVRLTGTLEWWHGWIRRVSGRTPWRGSFVWPYVRWKGTITLDGKVIEVDTMGLAELTRLERAK